MNNSIIHQFSNNRDVYGYSVTVAYILPQALGNGVSKDTHV